MTSPSILVFMPAYGEMNSVKTSASLIALALDLTTRGIKMGFATYSYFDLPRIRNLALTFWYDNAKDYTHLLFVDADMDFEPIVVRRMLEADEPLIGVVYPVRSVTTSTENRKFVASFLPETAPDERGMMPVKGLGGGIMLVRRDCVERLIADQPTIIDERPPHEVIHGDLMKEMGLSRVIGGFNYLTIAGDGIQRELGEDLSFCERVRRAGMTVWGSVCDPVGHVGPHTWFGCWGKPLPRDESAVGPKASS